MSSKAWRVERGFRVILHRSAEEPTVSLASTWHIEVCQVFLTGINACVNEGDYQFNEGINILRRESKLNLNFGKLEKEKQSVVGSEKVIEEKARTWSVINNNNVLQFHFQSTFTLFHFNSDNSPERQGETVLLSLFLCFLFFNKGRS